MTLRSHVALTLAAALALAGAARAMPTPDYLTAAGADALYERKASEIIASSSRDDKLRGYARMMVCDHRRADGVLRGAAIESGIVPPRPMLSDYQAAMLAQLQAAHGTRRDMLYVAQQRSAHRAALATQMNYAATGEQPALRAAAAQVIPALRQHLVLLDAMPTM